MFSHIQRLVIATVLDIYSDAARFQHLTWWEQYDWYKEAAGSSEHEPSGLIKSRNHNVSMYLSLNNTGLHRQIIFVVLFLLHTQNLFHLECKGIKTGTGVHPGKSDVSGNSRDKVPKNTNRRSELRATEPACAAITMTPN